MLEDFNAGMRIFSLMANFSLSVIDLQQNIAV